jgi:hypothetical protein
MPHNNLATQLNDSPASKLAVAAAAAAAGGDSWQRVGGGNGHCGGSLSVTESAAPAGPPPLP